VLSRLSPLRLIDVADPADTFIGENWEVESGRISSLTRFSATIDALVVMTAVFQTRGVDLPQGVGHSGSK
jgi:hypothetical protein